MQKKIQKVGSALFSFFLFILISININGQGFTNGSGNTFSLGSLTLSLSGNWSNSGTFTPGTSTVIFNGSGGNQTITNSSGETFNNLTVNKSSGNLQLSSNTTVNGTLTVTSGDVDLNGKTLTLGGSAILSETAGNTVKGTSGTITAERDLNAPNNLNVAGLGAEITSGENLGTTTITRGHAVQTGNDNNSISKYFDISPTFNDELDATLVFHYDDSELNGLNESELELYKSTDSGNNWTLRGGILSTTNKTVTFSGINGFSRWTLGASSLPLPVELTSFTAEIKGTNVLLKWETATEVNNYGFEVERQVSSKQSAVGNWVKIGFVEGNGNSNSPKEYSFIDEKPQIGNIKYRLKQIDTDGQFEYSDVVEVEIKEVLPTEYQLFQNYPNPFNPSTYISFALPKQSQVKLGVYNLLGQEVAEILNTTMEAGVHNVVFDASSLASGTYIYRIETAEYTSVKKMIILK